MSKSRCFKINAPGVVFENYEDEIVLINLDNGNYYSMTNEAAEIFGLIEKGLTQSEIIREILQKYQGNIENIQNIVNQFIAGLQDEGLIISMEKMIDDNSRKCDAETQPKLDSQKPVFAIPVLNRYSDMQDLILLDPVHEVDEAGWPNPKQDYVNLKK
jgi:hypothetical protein